MPQNKYNCPLCKNTYNTLKKLGQHIHHAHDQMTEELSEEMVAKYNTQLDEVIDLQRAQIREVKRNNELMEEATKELRRIRNGMRRY